MEFKEIEMEVLGLWIATEALDSMVNHALLKLLGREDPKEVHFKNHIHQKLFSILLLDFLEKVDYQLTNVKGSCLDLLEKYVIRVLSMKMVQLNFLRAPWVT